MDIQKEREDFEEKFPIPAHWIEFDKKRNKYFCPYCADAAASAYQSQWETWQAKAQAVLEGFVLVEKTKLMQIIGSAAIIEPITRGNPFMSKYKTELDFILSTVRAMIEAREQKG